MERQQRGYLNEPYRVFYNKGLPKQEVLPHYHDFRKLVILLSGRVGYMVEEQRYELSPGSLVFVDAGLIHRPLLYEGDEYERIIIYLSDAFLSSHPGLASGFELTRAAGNYAADLPQLQDLVQTRARLLTDGNCAGSRYAPALQEARLTEFLISAGDIIAGCSTPGTVSSTANPVILKIMDHISANLQGDLSVEALAGEVHLTGSYLMHLFKAETGYTLKEYVTDKRLFLARSLIEKGENMALAAERSGFNSYSSFYRCYMQKYGLSPKSTGRSALPGKAMIE